MTYGSVSETGQSKSAVSGWLAGRPVLAYAVLAAGLLLLGAGLLAALLGGAAGRAIWWAAGVAYLVQVGAFAVLWTMRGRAVRFFAAWGGGTLARMLVVGAGALLARGAGLPLAPLLVALAGFLFVLMLLEPLVFRAGLDNE